MHKIKKSFWGESTSVPTGMVHELALMLLAIDLFKPQLVSKDKLGTNNIKMKDVALILCKNLSDHTSGIDMISIHESSKWEGFNISDTT